MGLSMVVMPAAFTLSYWALHGFLAGSTVLSFAWLGWPLMVDSLRGIREGRANLETLLLVSSVGALGLSLIASLTGGKDLYYDVLPVVLAIYWFGILLGERSRRAADLALAELRASVDTVRVMMPGAASVRRPRSALGTGERVLVLAGETVPVDGAVVAGAATVIEAAITGEPFPVAKSAGQVVHAGSVIADSGHLEVLPDLGRATHLEGILGAVDRALTAPNSIQRDADRLLAWFLPLVVLAALGTLGGWTLAGQASAGFRHLLAVLLVACPCALGLATPLAVVAALHRLGKIGLAPRDGDLVLKLAEVDVVAFDKTGTLGEGLPAVEAVLLAPGVSVSEDELRGLIATVESLADHPLAASLARLASPVPLEGLEVRSVAGQGVVGVWKGGELRIGEPALMPSSADFAFAESLRGKRILVALDGRAAGVLLLRETLRSDAAPAISRLRELGLRVEVLTGDPSPAWASIEGAEVRSGLAPADKARRVRDLAAAGGRVLFVGDGLNDLEGMSAAHATVAMSRAADLTRHSCDAVLAVDRLEALPEAVELARRVRTDLRGNLALSVAYNLIGIALAAAGYLEPWSAALVMLVSSLLVAYRAIRAARPA
jgi:P-type Cu+ transporter